MGGKMSRDKGKRGEREIVNLHKEMGVHAVRTAALQAGGDPTACDVLIDGWLGAEVKYKKSVPSTIYKYLKDTDVAFVKRDRKPVVVLMTWEKYKLLVWKET